MLLVPNSGPGSAGLGESLDDAELLESGDVPATEEQRVRLAQAAAESFAFIWRVLRRLGVRPDHAVDDAVQRVFEIAARKTQRIREGAERAFLFKIAVLVAAEERRRQRRALSRDAIDAAANLASTDLDPEGALEQRRARALLDEALDSLPDKLRTVFVLFELEGLSCREIAELVGVPQGTAASRLRLAREQFHGAARNLKAREPVRRP